MAPITYRKFRQVVLIPKDVLVKSVSLYSGFTACAGSWTSHVLSDGRTMLTFQADEVPGGISDLARIQVSIGSRAQNELEYPCISYIDFDLNEGDEVKILNPKFQELENKTLSTAETSFTLRRHQSRYLVKEIRRPDSQGADQFWTTSIDTLPTETLEYAIVLRNELNTPAEKVQILDVFPHLNDYNLVESSHGSRAKRNSAQSNDLVSVEAKVIDITSNESNTLPIQYLHTRPGNLQGKIDDWLASLDATQLNDNPEGAMGILVGDGSDQLPPFSYIEVIIKMTAPDTDKWKDKMVNSAAWRQKGEPFIEGNTVQNTMKEPTRDVTVKKVDEQGQPLAGANFALRLNGSVRTYLTTNNKGEATFTDIPFVDGYSIYENRAPVGYIKSDQTYVIPADRQSDAEPVIFVNQRDLPAEGRIVIRKSDKSTGEPIAGVVFSLTKLVGSTWEQQSHATTNQQGEARFESLEGGNYRIRESQALKGYIPHEAAINVVLDPAVKEDAEINLVNAAMEIRVDKVEHLSAHPDQLSQLRNDYPDAFVAEGQVYRPLAGASFELREEGNKATLIPVTSTEGRLNIYRDLEYGKNYWLTETAAPQGFEAGAPIRISTTGGFSREVPTRTLYVENSPMLGSITVKKLSNEEGATLAGASFGLYTSPGLEIDRKTTEATGQVCFQGLRIGSYQVQELEAPPDMAVDPDVYEIEITHSDLHKSLDITNAYKRIALKGQVIWEDKDNQDGIRPKEVTLSLYLDDQCLDSKLIKANEAGVWPYVFEGLRFSENGNPLPYEIKGETFDGYGCRVVDGEVIYSHDPLARTLKVTVEWDDLKDRHKKRPASLWVQLLVDGQPSGQAIEVTGKDGWQLTLPDLPTNEEGKALDYTLSISGIPSIYKSQMILLDTDNFLVKNRYRLVVPDNPDPDPSKDPDPKPTDDPDPKPSSDPDPTLPDDPGPQPTADPDPEQSLDPDPTRPDEPDPNLPEPTGPKESDAPIPGQTEVTEPGPESSQTEPSDPTGPADSEPQASQDPDPGEPEEPKETGTETIVPAPGERNLHGVLGVLLLLLAGIVLVLRPKRS